jgi:carboxylate-amine ligase
MVRTFGVEEELLVVDARTARPVARGVEIVAAVGKPASGHELATEFKAEQLEVVGPPQTTLEGQLEAIRAGRAIADAAARRFGARVAALSTCPWPVASTRVGGTRYDRMATRFGITAAEQLTCGYHVHVEIASDEEGVAVLDRLRVWLPAILALGANSPFWMGADTGYASYRYQVWGRWPTSGPCQEFGTVENYRRHCDELLGSGAALDEGMLYFDARLSARFPTVEVRVSDLCLDPEHAAVVAELIRALVETSARQWRDGGRPSGVSAPLLRAWNWHASRFGLEADLPSPVTGAFEPAWAVVGQLLDAVRPVLDDHGTTRAVTSVLDDLMHGGTGAARQRRAHREAGATPSALRAVVEAGLASHSDPTGQEWDGTQPAGIR